MPERIQRRRAKGWKMPENTVYVGRPGPWGNPFITSKHGTQKECVEWYTAMLGIGNVLGCGNVEEQKQARQHIINHLEDLRGRNLACWCRIGTPCHADILLELANS